MVVETVVGDTLVFNDEYAVDGRVMTGEVLTNLAVDGIADVDFS